MTNSLNIINSSLLKNTIEIKKNNVSTEILLNILEKKKISIVYTLSEDFSEKFSIVELKHAFEEFVDTVTDIISFKDGDKLRQLCESGLNFKDLVQLVIITPIENRDRRRLFENATFQKIQKAIHELDDPDITRFTYTELGKKNSDFLNTRNIIFLFPTKKKQGVINNYAMSIFQEKCMGGYYDKDSSRFIFEPDFEIPNIDYCILSINNNSYIGDLGCLSVKNISTGICLQYHLSDYDNHLICYTNYINSNLPDIDIKGFVNSIGARVIPPTIPVIFEKYNLKLSLGIQNEKLDYYFDFNQLAFADGSKTKTMLELGLNLPEVNNFPIDAKNINFHFDTGVYIFNLSSIKKSNIEFKKYENNNYSFYALLKDLHHPTILNYGA